MVIKKLIEVTYVVVVKQKRQFLKTVYVPEDTLVSAIISVDDYCKYNPDIVSYKIKEAKFVDLEVLTG